MQPIYERAVADVLAAAARWKPSEESDDVPVVALQFYEIYCGSVFDLLSQPLPRAEVRTMEDGQGELQVVGLAEELLTDPASAVEAVRRGQAARVTSANAVHDDSSRSHAVLQLVVRSAVSGQQRGRLSLVDLARSPGLVAIPVRSHRVIAVRRRPGRSGHRRQWRTTW